MWNNVKYAIKNIILLINNKISTKKIKIKKKNIRKKKKTIFIIKFYLKSLFIIKIK